MSNLLLKAFIRTHVLMYRSTGGRLGASLAGIDHLLLTTTGRKTGKTRTIPIACLQHDDRLLVVASNNGQDHHPAWYLNLVASPAVEVQFGKTRKATRARTASPEERTKLWPQLKQYNRMFARYEKRTSREIPVIIIDWY